MLVLAKTAGAPTCANAASAATADAAAAAAAADEGDGVAALDADDPYDLELLLAGGGGFRCGCGQGCGREIERITISLAGGVTRVRTRCSFLAAAGVAWARATGPAAARCAHRS